MNNGIFVQNLIDKQSSDIGLPRNSLFNNTIIPLPYGYGGDEYWKYDPNKLVLLYDTRYGSNTTITLPLSSGPAYTILVDWGDGNISRHSGTTQNVNYTYSSHGVYLVQISGTLTAFGTNFTNANANKLIKCLSFGNFPLTALYYALDNCVNLIEIPDTIPSSVAQFQFCFRNCTKLNSLSILKWILSNNTNFVAMFKGSSSLNQPISNITVNTNTSCQEMFQSCVGMTSIILSGWVFSGNNNAQSMFFGCRNFRGNGLEDWNTSGITNMAGMLNLTSVNTDISSWDTSNVTNMVSMFSDNPAFNQPIGSWDTSKVTAMNSMFRNATAFNQNIGAWNVSSVTNFSDMFSGRTFNNGGSSDINNWNTSSGTNMSTMFQSNTGFNQPLNNWNVRKVTNFSSMFQGATSFNSSLSGWALGADTAGTNCFGMFQFSRFNQPLSDWDTSKITNMGNMFANQTSVAGFNQDIGSWDTSSVTQMGLMFYANSFFNNGGSSSINNWNISNVTNMANMFVNAFAFNQPIGNWNVSKVTNMSQMFSSAYAFNQDISNWNLAGLNASTSLDSFMFNKSGANALSTANYDALLIGWNNNKLIGANGVANWRTDLRPHFGGAKYTAGGAAAAARAALVSYGWTITDGGTA